MELHSSELQRATRWHGPRSPVHCIYPNPAIQRVPLRSDILADSRLFIMFCASSAWTTAIGHPTKGLTAQSPHKMVENTLTRSLALPCASIRALSWSKGHLATSIWISNEAICLPLMVFCSSLRCGITAGRQFWRWLRVEFGNTFRRDEGELRIRCWTVSRFHHCGSEDIGRSFHFPPVSRWLDSCQRLGGGGQFDGQRRTGFGLLSPKLVFPPPPTTLSPSDSITSELILDLKLSTKTSYSFRT